MLAPLLFFGLSNNPNTSASRPVSVYVNGRDLTPNIDVTTLHYAQTGSHETGQATFQVHDVKGGGTTYPELTDGAPIRIYDARLDKDNWGGFVISRTTTIVGAGTIVDVTAVDLSVLLDRANINSESSGGLSSSGSDITRLAYLMGLYGGRLTPDAITYTVRSTAISDSQTLTSTSLRMAVESITALAYGVDVGAFGSSYPTIDYFIDPIGRLVYGAGFQVPAAPGQAVVNGLPPADGSTYVTTLKAAAANYWRCNETSGTTLADSVGSSTATVVGNAPFGTAILPTISSVVGPIPKLFPNVGLMGGWAGFTSSANFEVAQTAAFVTNVTDNFAVEFWFTLLPIQPSGGTDCYLFYNGSSGVNGFGVYLAGASNKTFPYSISVSYGGVGSWSTGFTITDQAWHHFALEKRNGVSTPFLDGIAGTTSALVPGAATTVTTLWGDGTGGGKDANRFNGGLAHVAVYH